MNSEYQFTFYNYFLQLIGQFNKGFLLHVTDINECSRPGACGLGADCVNLAGSFKCQCPEGSVPDPDPQTKCVSIVTCKTDSDCPGNAKCDNQKRCLCPEPNIGNECRRKWTNLKETTNIFNLDYFVNCIIITSINMYILGPVFYLSYIKLQQCKLYLNQLTPSSLIRLVSNLCRVQ